MTQQAPGKWFREGISLIELTERFPDEASAAKWLEEVIPSSIEGDSFRGFPNGKKSESMRRTDTEVRHGQSGCVTGRF